MSHKILIVFGTRPEVIKLAPLILALKNSALKNNFIVASTSQHEDLLDEQLNYWKITPDYYLTPSSNKGNLTRLLSHTLSGLQDIIEQVATIQYIVVQGDTNTALACSNLAFLNQLKLIHVESGLRSFNLFNPFPEEFNRVIASKVAYFHFAPTETSKANLLKEGIDPLKIMVIGNTVIDALYLAKKSNETSIINEQTTVLITLHRRENIVRNYLILSDIIRDLANQHAQISFIWVTHPNCANEIRSVIETTDNIKVQDRMPYKQFVGLYETAKMVITDSGGVSEEAIHLGLPIIIFRKTTERIEAIYEQYPMIVTVQKAEIISFFNNNIHKTNKTKYSYGNGNASKMIVDWFSKEINFTDFDTLIVGGGPAGTGLLFKALKDGKNNNFFDKRISLVEKSSHLVKGNITQYKINSDTYTDVFLECLEGATGDFINQKSLKNEIDFIGKYKGSSIPLHQLNNYYIKLGLLLKQELETSKKVNFFMESIVNKIIQKDNGTYEVNIANKNESITARQIIIATGGIPINILDENEAFAGIIPLQKYREKIEYADHILKCGINNNLKTKLLKKSKVVILGGSHSAFSVAHFLLNSSDSYLFKSNDIKIWCRAKPKIYFNSKEDAFQCGYTDFSNTDFCTVTNKLYRLAGLRMDGRDLYMKMLGLGNAKKETRVCLNLFEGKIKEIERDLNDATLIIVAYGYKLNIPLFINKFGEQINFKGNYTKHWVNNNCELLDENGCIISNVFATGLATGFIPTGDLGGEPSFEGQTNGIWYYQNAIADRIINSL